MPRDSIAPGWDCHVHVFDGQAPPLPGHYAAAHHPLETIETLANSHGFGHVVLVQPSAHGTDNTLLLKTLQASPGRHRGVVVVDASVSDADLRRRHGSWGCGGCALNLVSPTGNHADIRSNFLALAPRMEFLGWHLQWYARPDDLPTIAALHHHTTVLRCLTFGLSPTRMFRLDLCCPGRRNARGEFWAHG